MPAAWFTLANLGFQKSRGVEALAGTEKSRGVEAFAGTVSGEPAKVSIPILTKSERAAILNGSHLG
ncbi:MAG: hypothetical protein DWQ04_08975 [Chloroflexi bacterium]|nr:MAG: hypothetical protein DWQ04_08975 [Chloroflexota bacterium]